MTSYAPLLAKDKHHNWNPDLIYFTNSSVRTTPSYETQRLFSKYSGDRHVASNITADETISRRVVASVVEDSKSGHRYLKLVNALPVSLSLTVEGIALPQGTTFEGFNGKPDNQSVTIEQGSCEEGTLVLPPYSMRVYQF